MVSNRHQTRLSDYLPQLGFYLSLANPSLIISHSNHGVLILLLYIDDMVVKGDNPQRIQWLISQLNTQFSIKDLGFHHHFLGIEVHKHGTGLFLSMHWYIVDLLTRASMRESKPLSTPMPSKGQQKYGAHELFTDVKTYKSFVGALQYLTFTRPDISYSVNYFWQFMQTSTMTYFQLVKKILRYLQGTATLGLRILSNSTPNLYGFQMQIGLAALLQEGLQQVFARFLEVIVYHGVQRNNSGQIKCRS